MTRVKSSWGAIQSEWKDKRVTIVNTHICAGAKGIVRKQSQRSGYLTVELTEKCGCYRVGDTILFMPYEVERE